MFAMQQALLYCKIVFIHLHPLASANGIFLMIAKNGSFLPQIDPLQADI